MASKFSDQMSGFISLRLRGQAPEKILNMALARGIYIWDIKRRDDGIYLKVRTSGYEAFRTITEESHYELEILQKQGMPLYKNIMKRRLGLLGGALLFILTLYLMSSFVWFVQVSGNSNVDRDRILTSAARNGIHVGAGKWTFNRIEAEEAMLRELSEITYIQCDIRGVKVNIKVVEKILPDLNVVGPCHMVAKRDGVVDEVLVLDGQANVKKGDVVAKGDILISGIVFPGVAEGMEGVPAPSPEPYQVRARGQVKARTWYDGYGESIRKLEERVFSGKEYHRLYLQTPWKTIFFKGGAGNPFSLYEESEKQWSPAGDWVIGRVEIKEQTIKITEYNESQAVEKAREKALANLRENMPGNLKISDSHIEVLSSPSDSIVRIKVAAETVEDICIAEPISGPEISN